MSERVSKFNWLKLTNGHRFTGAEFRVLISLFNHSDRDGRRAHPGIDLMVGETGYRKTGISEAITALKERGWIHETYRGNGRSRQASEFDLVPDAPNPAYRCDSRRCVTCSNGSALPEPLDGGNGGNGSGLPEPSGANGSAGAFKGSAVAVPIVPLERSPSDPGSDPSKGSDPISVEEPAPPSDPDEVRYPPDHVEVHVESPSLGEPLPEEAGKKTMTARLSSGGQEAAEDLLSANQSQPARAGDGDLMSGSDDWGDPFGGLSEAVSFDPFDSVGFEEDPDSIFSRPPQFAWEDYEPVEGDEDDPFSLAFKPKNAAP